MNKRCLKLLVALIAQNTFSSIFIVYVVVHAGYIPDHAGYIVVHEGYMAAKVMLSVKAKLSARWRMHSARTNLGHLISKSAIFCISGVHQKHYP